MSAAPADSQHDRLAGEVTKLLFEVLELHKGTWRDTMAELALTPPQAHLLRLLEPGVGTPMRALADHLMCDASNVTGLVDRLEARGAVERTADPADRRVKAIVLTAEGERLRRAMHERMTRPSAALAEVPPDTLARLRDALAEVLTVGRKPAPGP